MRAWWTEDCDGLSLDILLGGWAGEAIVSRQDAVALVRRHLWLASEPLSTSRSETDVAKIPVPLFNRLIDSLAYAA